MLFRLSLSAAALALLAACSGTTPTQQGSAQAAATAQPAAAAPAPRAQAPAPAPASAPVRYGAADSGPYIHDLLKTDQAQRAWRRMTASRKAPQWIGRAQGPANPSQAVTIGSQRYWLGTVCETHNCPNTFFYLMGTDRAYGLHADFAVPHAARPLFYGKPPQAERAVLQQAFEQERQRYIRDLPPAN